MGEMELKLAETAAGFLAKQMEQKEGGLVEGHLNFFGQVPWYNYGNGS